MCSFTRPGNLTGRKCERGQNQPLREMPFSETGTYPISNKDVLSFTFDGPDFDVDRPVSQARKIERSTVTNQSRC